MKDAETDALLRGPGRDPGCGRGTVRGELYGIQTWIKYIGSVTWSGQGSVKGVVKEEQIGDPVGRDLNFPRTFSLAKCKRQANANGMERFFAITEGTLKDTEKAGLQLRTDSSLFRTEGSMMEGRHHEPIQLLWSSLEALLHMPPSPSEIRQEATWKRAFLITAGELQNSLPGESHLLLSIAI